MKYLGFLLFMFILFACQRNDDSSNPGEGPQEEDLYFPSASTWENVDPEDLGWNTENIDALYDLLEISGTKGFVVLYKGKIALEAYFNGSNQNTNVAWNSAGKTLTSLMVGIAQENGFLDLDDPATDYLGASWTSMTPEQENAIKIWNMLTMTSGGDYTVDNTACYDPECLLYLNPPGEEWFYHNAFYTLLQPVLDAAYPEGWDNAFNTRLRNKIGMNGQWITLGYNNVYFSTARSMARYGLLVQAGGTWDGSKIMDNPGYYNQMINTSQDLNPSYGYLWWLNGKSSYRLPGSTQDIPGNLIPDAPTDLVAGLGANDKKLYIVPSKDLVVVRMGDEASEELLGPSGYDNQLWQKINEIIN